MAERRQTKTPRAADAEQLARGPRREEEETREVTGFDAEIELAQAGDAGSGASRFGGDFAGVDTGFDHDTVPSLEADPATPRDISPDHIELGREAEGAEEDEGEELTARPKDGERPMDVASSPEP